MTWVQALVLAVLQGASELFPVSSLGHTVLVPALLHWKIDRSAPTFLSFVVALHFGTAFALVLFYRNDWMRIVRALIASIARGELSHDPDERVGWLLVVGTVPVALLGVFLEGPIREFFASSALVAGFLIANAFVMFAGEALRRRTLVTQGRTILRPLPDLPWSAGARVGLAQAAALLPGISRSGASMVAALLLRLTHEDAARYSFLLATPVIFAASVLELPRLFAGSNVVLEQSAVGALLAALTAYASVAFLTRWFSAHDLRPFGWYCLILGTACLVLALTKVIA